MSISEFELIGRYFSQKLARRDVVLGVGDDGAVLKVPPGNDLVVSMDTLAAGVHFPECADPESIGFKSLAVGLSDMAAMGAEPAWATLSITLPEADRSWLAAFSRGLFKLAGEFEVQLVGGDTTHGPLSVTVQVHGFVPSGTAVRRAGARAGDLVYVTGTLGDAGLALRSLKSGLRLPERDLAYLMGRLNRPRPRVREALLLRGLFHAAVDISDGLAADLGHILSASHKGATLYVEKLPLSPAFISWRQSTGPQSFASAGGAEGTGQSSGYAWPDFPLVSGDDYELCFTIDPRFQTQLGERLRGESCPCTCVGVIEERPGLRIVTTNGEHITPATSGYDHFGG